MVIGLRGAQSEDARIHWPAAILASAVFDDMVGVSARKATLGDILVYGFSLVISTPLSCKVAKASLRWLGCNQAIGGDPVSGGVQR